MKFGTVILWRDSYQDYVEELRVFIPKKGICVVNPSTWMGILVGSRRSASASFSFRPQIRMSCTCKEDRLIWRRMSSIPPAPSMLTGVGPSCILSGGSDCRIR